MFKIDIKTKEEILQHLEYARLMKGEEDTLTEEEINQINTSLHIMRTHSLILNHVALRGKMRYEQKQRK